MEESAPLFEREQYKRNLLWFKRTLEDLLEWRDSGFEMGALPRPENPERVRQKELEAKEESRRIEMSLIGSKLAVKMS